MGRRRNSEQGFTGGRHGWDASCIRRRQERNVLWRYLGDPVAPADRQELQVGRLRLSENAWDARRPEARRRRGQRNLRVVLDRPEETRRGDQVHRILNASRSCNALSGAGAADRRFDQGRASGRGRLRVELRKDAFPNTIKFLDWIWPSEVATATASAIGGVVGGTITPEQAAASVQAVFDDLKAQGNWPPK